MDMSQRVVEVRPAAIRVVDRHRSDLGDLDSLKESIQEVGLLHPIVCRMENERLVLVAGERRLEACKQLGKSLVQVIVAKSLDSATKALTAERDENQCRKAMTPTELKSLTDALLEIERPAAKERQGTRTDLHQEPVDRSGHKSSDKKRAKSEAANAAGWSRASYERVDRIERAAEDESLPESVRQVAADCLSQLEANAMTPNAADAALQEAKLNAGIASTTEKIKRAKRDNPGTPTPTSSGKSKAEIEHKVATYKRMAGEGYSTRQIAPAIGVGFASMWQFRKRHGLDKPPADDIVGKTRRHDSTRIVEEAVNALEGFRVTFDLIDFADLEGDADYWVSSLNESIRSLTTLRNNIKKELIPVAS